MRKKKLSSKKNIDIDNKPEDKKEKKIPLWKRILTIFVITLLSLVTLTMMLAVGVYCYIFEDYSQATVTLDVEKIGISDKAPKEDLFHVAVFGIDSKDQHVGRADSIMIFTVDKEHKQLKLTSILRDSYVPIKDRGNDKINHAYAYGGAELMLHTINQNFNMNIKEYVVLDFSDVAMLVDAIGGLDMVITEAERQQINVNAGEIGDNVPEITSSGKVHLNGAQVTAYGRIRNIDNEVERSGRQRHVIQCVMDKVKEQGLLEYPKLIHDFLPLLETTLSQGELTGLAVEVLSYDWNIKNHVIPDDEENAIGGIYNGMWCWRFDLDDATKRWHEFLKNEI